MKVLFFARGRAAAGCDHGFLSIGKPVTQPEFWDALVREFPGLADLRRSARLARREVYLDPDERLEPGDEIAVIPPVSGG